MSKKISACDKLCKAEDRDYGYVQINGGGLPKSNRNGRGPAETRLRDL